MKKKKGQGKLMCVYFRDLIYLYFVSNQTQLLQLQLVQSLIVHIGSCT